MGILLETIKETAREETITTTKENHTLLKQSQIYHMIFTLKPPTRKK